jgi:hypothetical protein
LSTIAGATVDMAEVVELRTDVEEIACRHKELVKLLDDGWDALVAALVDAIGFAKVGLGDILAGKRARPAAWTTDVLVRDVCDVLRTAGVPAPMTQRRDGSLAQRLADDLAALAGLPDQGELFKQMQRGARIEKAGGPTCPKQPVLILGEWQVPG